MNWIYFERANGNCILECANCGATAEYSNKSLALQNTPEEPHCVNVDIPFMGEPTDVEDDFSNGLAVGVDY